MKQAQISQATCYLCCPTNMCQNNTGNRKLKFSWSSKNTKQYEQEYNTAVTTVISEHCSHLSCNSSRNFTHLRNRCSRELVALSSDITLKDSTVSPSLQTDDRPMDMNSQKPTNTQQNSKKTSTTHSHFKLYKSNCKQSTSHS